MTNLSKSKIEYLTHTWNFYTGCQNGPDICPLGERCWSRRMAARFHRSFEPEFHPDIFQARMPLEPARIGVCFTGDLFGDWVNPRLIIPITDSLDIELSDGIKLCLRMNSEHQFFFLTKCPWNLHKWGEFPDNAWVGVSVCNASQVWGAIEELKGVRASHKWLSLEPLQDDIFAPTWELNGYFVGIDWIVVGGQTGPRQLPRYEWVTNIALAADRHGIPIFLKNNLNTCEISDYPELLDAHGNLRQELPGSWAL
jgi:protein gp37